MRARAPRRTMDGMPTGSDIASAPNFATTSAREVVSCRVCGRTLLIGERSTGFFTASGEGPYDVCELCVHRAPRYGLRPRPSSAEEVARHRRAGAMARLVGSLRAVVEGRRTEPRDRRRAKEIALQGTAAVAAAAAAAPAKPGPLAGMRARRAAAAAPLDPAALGAVPVGAAAIPIAVATFNQSPHARTLAGLFRTLGAPRASIQPRSSTDREVIITVAWEIVWYQFRVMPDGIEQQSGQYLSELALRWQRWNGTVGSDGTVRETGAGEATSGKDSAHHAASEDGSTR